MKEADYKSMVCQILEYGSSVWDPYTDKLPEELEKVQDRVARFVTRNYVYEAGRMTGILGQLKWESLKKRRKDNKSNRTAMNRNWGNQKANPALKTETGNI